VSATALLAKVPAFSILTDFTHRVVDEQTPAQVLDTLHELTSSHLPLSVLGAVRIPLKFSDLRSMRLGKDVFLHASVPEGWWDEHVAITARTEHNPAMMMARSNLMTFTWTETMQLMDPVGIDRWPYELALMYGIRDALICSLARLVGRLLVPKGLGQRSHAADAHRSLRCRQLCCAAPGSAD